MVFLLMRALDLIYLLALYLSAGYVKFYFLPTTDSAWQVNATASTGIVSVIDHGDWLQHMPWVALASMFVLIEEDVRTVFIWWGTAKKQFSRAVAAGKADYTNLQWVRLRAGVQLRDLRILLQWSSSHDIPIRFLGYLLSLAALVNLLIVRAELPSAGSQDTEKLRQITDRLNAYLAPLALGLTVQTLLFFRVALAPAERMGIFYNTVFKMLRSDVTLWLVVFAAFFLNCAVVMVVCYPAFERTSRALGSTSLPASLEPVPEFAGQRIIPAIWAIAELALVGEPIGVNWDVYFTSEFTDNEGSAAYINTVFFVGAYVLYIVVALILLLNLLIAMMGDTYKNTQDNSTLEWRFGFARLVLRLELQCLFAGARGWVELECGEIGYDPVTGDEIYVHKYLNFKPNAEGGGTRGLVAMFEEDVEKEAAEHDKDDDGPGAGDIESTIKEHQVVAFNAPAAAPAAADIGKRVQLETPSDRSSRGLAGQRKLTKKQLSQCSLCNTATTSSSTASIHSTTRNHVVTAVHAVDAPDAVHDGGLETVILDGDTPR